MTEHRFNIRVYGLLIHNHNILVSDEFRMNTLMTKFPGGALEFGEGTIDCLKREFMEELNTKIDIIRHFYTTDYYQPTKLLPATMQLISIYYLVECLQLRLNSPPLKCHLISLKKWMAHKASAGFH